MLQIQHCASFLSIDSTIGQQMQRLLLPERRDIRLTRYPFIPLSTRPFLPCRQLHQLPLAEGSL